MFVHIVSLWDHRFNITLMRCRAEKLDLNQETRIKHFQVCDSDHVRVSQIKVAYFATYIFLLDHPASRHSNLFLPNSLLETCFPLCQHSCWKHQCHQLQFADQIGCHAHPNLSVVFHDYPRLDPKKRRRLPPRNCQFSIWSLPFLGIDMIWYDWYVM